MERNGHSMVTDAATIETVFTGTGNKWFSEGDSVLFPIVILYQGADLGRRLSSDGNGHVAPNKRVDSFLQTISWNLLYYVEYEGMMPCHCWISSSELGLS
jgi:hypothetical protein